MFHFLKNEMKEQHGSQTTEADHRHKEAAKKTRKEKTRALILAVENMDEESQDFNYIDSQRNNEALDEMYERQRQRRDNIEINATRRIEAITEEEIRIEIQNIWRIQHLECPEEKKRSRIREKDKQQARSNIVRKIRFEETDIEDQFYYSKNKK